LALLRRGQGRWGRGETGGHEQNRDGDDDTAQPAVIRGISSAFFGLTPLSCASIILNLFSLCFARLLFLLFLLFLRPQRIVPTREVQIVHHSAGFLAIRLHQIGVEATRGDPLFLIAGELLQLFVERRELSAKFGDRGPTAREVLCKGVVLQ
jgi:hypothetical protein